MSRTREQGRPGQGGCGVSAPLPGGPRACARESADVAEGDADGRTVGFRSCAGTEQSRRLRFPTGDEVVLTVRDAAGAVVWRWQPSEPTTEGAHEEVLAPGECLTWSTRWRHVDDAGRPVPQGVYSLVVDYLERDAAGQHRSAFTY